jgi:acylphosphatase
MERFVSEERQARRYFVRGMVQGVGFRYFTQGEAERLRVGGYVRNLMDGRVEVYAIGSEGQLAQIRTAIEQGPRGAMVTEVAEEPAIVELQYAEEFRITYDR